MNEKLQQWKFHPPTKYDFDYAFEPFVLDSYLFVLYGLGFKTELKANESAYNQESTARDKFDEINRLTERLKLELPTHRQLIDKVYQYGFQSI